MLVGSASTGRLGSSVLSAMLVIAKGVKIEAQVAGLWRAARVVGVSHARAAPIKARTSLWAETTFAGQTGRFDAVRRRASILAVWERGSCASDVGLVLRRFGSMAFGADAFAG